MAKKSKEFVHFGIAYRTTQFDAVTGMRFITLDGFQDRPETALANTEAWDGAHWHRLDSRKAINELVYDAARAIPPLLALRGVLSTVREFNFGFIKGWKGVRVPSRFFAEAEGVASVHVTPMIGAIIQNGAATLKELEEYYSLEDAFKLFDVITSKSVNEALANEMAIKKKGKR